MRDSDEPYGRWLDLLGELLRQPLTALPHETLVYTLIDTFQAKLVRRRRQRRWPRLAAGVHQPAPDRGVPSHPLR